MANIGGMEYLADWIENTEGVAELKGTQTQSEGVGPQHADSVLLHGSSLIII